MTNLEGKEAPSVENKHDLPGEKREESGYRAQDELEAEVAEAGVTQDQKSLGAIAEPKHKQRQGQRVAAQGLSGSRNIFCVSPARRCTTAKSFFAHGAVTSFRIKVIYNTQIIPQVSFLLKLLN